MGELPASFGKVTYEETRVQAATTQDLITKLGSNHKYLYDNITDTLPSNDAAIQTGINDMVARNPNFKMTLVKTVHLEFSRSDFMPMIAYRRNGSNQTASIIFGYYDDDYKMKIDFPKESDIATFPMGETRIYCVGMRGDVEHTDFDVYRVEQV